LRLQEFIAFDHGQRDQDVCLLACVVSNVPGAGAARLAFYVVVGSAGHMLPPALHARYPLLVTY
jgi:hypothetical protein